MNKLKSHKTFSGHTEFWEHESTSTKTKMKFSTFIPENRSPDGALIWLSGLTCTDENFITKAGAQRYLAEHNLMVICPDTSPRGLDLPGEHESYDFGSGAGFYVDALTPGYRDHYRMYTYVSSELYRLLQEEFKVRRVSISGHSMGGHGALVIGLRETDKFASISAFSPIVNPSQCAWGQKAFAGYLGDSSPQEREKWIQYDATELIRQGLRHPGSILVDQGTSDEFLEKQLLTENLKSAAQKAGQKLEAHYREAYDHSYYFISTFIESHIEFHAKALKS